MTASEDLQGLVSPVSGASLVPDGPHALREPDGRRWPVVDGIPYLRVGREALTAQALERLDAGDRIGALVALLADQDDWWDGPAADAGDLARLADSVESLTLRDAMSLLGFGRVGDYFAHRWSDPTYLAGLALVEAHRGPMTSAFELACGIGHYGREFLRRGVAYTGADVVFAKLWLARHWVTGPAARLLCCDAAAPWPSAERGFDLVLCQDAFYFLEPKPEILARLRALTAPGGWLAIGHIHNREADNHSAGRAVGADELSGFFPDGVFYDDLELTRALVEARAPVPRPPEALRQVAAFAVAAGPGRQPAPRVLAGGYAMPVDDASLAVNPLYGVEPSPTGRGLPLPEQASLRFPSARYAAEYGPLASYPVRFEPPHDAASRASAIRRRALVDLPVRW